MKQIFLEVPVERKEQREKLFLAFVSERVITGNLGLVPPIDQARFVEILDQELKTKNKLAKELEYSYRTVQQNLKKHRPKPIQHSYQIVQTAPNKIRQKCHKHQKSVHQEQQTMDEFSDEIIDQFAINQVRSEQNSRIDNHNERQNQQDKQIPEFKIDDLRDDEMITNKEIVSPHGSIAIIFAPQQSRQDLLQDSQNISSKSHISHNDAKSPDKSLSGLPQSNIQSVEQITDRSGNKLVIRQPSRSNHSNQSNHSHQKLQDNSFQSRLDSRQDQILSPKGLQNSVDEDNTKFREATTKLDRTQFQENQQQEEENKNLTEHETRIKEIAADENTFSQAYIMFQGQKKLSIDSISQQSIISSPTRMVKQFPDEGLPQDALRYIRSEQDFNKYVIDPINLDQARSKSQISVTSISQIEKIEYDQNGIQIHVNQIANNQQTILEESIEASPNQRSRIIKDLSQNKQTLNIVGQGDRQVAQFNSNPSEVTDRNSRQPIQTQQSNQSNVQNTNLQRFQNQTNQRQLQTPQVARVQKVPSFRNNNQNQGSGNQITSQGNINPIKRQKPALKNYQSSQQVLKSEESQEPKSNMTIESSAGDKSSRSRKQKKSGRQLNRPNLQASRRPSNREDPEKLKLQEKERQKQIEYQKLMEKLRQEREFMEQFKIPDHVPLSQKKLIIENLIKEVQGITDQDVKFQIQLYNQRQEQIQSQSKYIHEKLDSHYDQLTNCYNDLDALLENKLKLKNKDQNQEIQKITTLRFGDQIQTLFPGQQREFQRDDPSPTKRQYKTISQLDPREIENMLKRKEQFHQESQLIKEMQKYKSHYGEMVKQYDVNDKFNRDIDQNYKFQSTFFPRVDGKKKSTKKGRPKAITYLVEASKVQELIERKNRIQQIGRHLINQ